MKTIKINLYKFNELSSEAQQTALERLSDININYNWWRTTYEDARNVGVEIEEFDLSRRQISGGVMSSAGETVESILKEHGKDCETYKTALRYKHSFQQNSSEQDEEELNETERYFEQEILEDYLNILRKEYEYLSSKEAIIETIQANEYDFTEEGHLY